MTWIFFALGAALAWGLYGPVLHRGQVDLGSPMRALLCVGVAYFLIGVLVPVVSLSTQSGLQGLTMKLPAFTQFRSSRVRRCWIISGSCRRLWGGE